MIIQLPQQIDSSDLFEALKQALATVAGIGINADGSISDPSNNGIKLTVGGAVYDLADSGVLVADFTAQALISRDDSTKMIIWSAGDLEFSDPSIGVILQSRPSKNKFRLFINDAGEVRTEPV